MQPDIFAKLEFYIDVKYCPLIKIIVYKKFYKYTGIYKKGIKCVAFAWFLILLDWR